ncbi:MAG: endonuclease domain-containing protein, partial [Bacteroidetes bacterium]|nr:endonuclease domain-containing protein [Bacteroidota bacterium]
QDSTPAEKKLWHELRNRKLSGWKFLRQHPIFYDLNGKESFFIVDFYCHEKKLIIELDGEMHKRQLKEDAERKKIKQLTPVSLFQRKGDATPLLCKSGDRGELEK